MTFFFLLVQIMDLVDELFVFMFTELNEKCKKELEAVGKQYPFEPLKVNPIRSIKKLNFLLVSYWILMILRKKNCSFLKKH